MSPKTLFFATYLWTRPYLYSNNIPSDQVKYNFTLLRSPDQWGVAESYVFEPPVEKKVQHETPRVRSVSLICSPEMRAR